MPLSNLIRDTTLDRQDNPTCDRRPISGCVPTTFRRPKGVVCLFNLRVRFQHCGSILSTEVTPDARLMKPP
jgi:hypothetical protein